MKLDRPTLALALAAWTLAAAPAAAEPLTLQAAQAAALARSAALAATQRMAGAAREREVAAGQLPDPVLRFSLNNLPIDGPDRFSPTRDFMTMRGVSVMQMLPRETKRRAAAARYGSEAAQARAEEALRALAIRRDVALAWFERRAAEQQLALVAEQREEAALQVVAAEAAFRAGRGMQADIFMARDAAARLQQATLAAELALANSRRQLARFTGGDPATALAAAPSIAMLTRPDQAVVQPEQLHRHADLALADARTAVADAEAEMARQEQRPDWSVEFMFSQRGSAYSNMISVVLTVPLPWDRTQRQDREVAARLALREQLAAEREEMRRQHEAQTADWLAGWRSAQERLALFERERIPLARQRTHAALASYRGGSAPLGAVLEARRMELELTQERIQTELEVARLWAQLENLVPPATPGVQP
jgi:outer membrane protein TolC